MKKGFTIIETLVAISILVGAVMGATLAIQTGISSYTFSKEQITAFYLAQEGFEQIQNMRDENALKGDFWLTDIAQNNTDPCFFGQSCRVSPVDSNTATRCPGVGACELLRHQLAIAGFFGYNVTWPVTNYTRDIQLTSINAHEILVSVSVKWSKGILTHEFKSTKSMFDL